MVDKWSVIYFMGCTLGWGFSTFIMGFLGKEDISFETMLFYQSVGAALVGGSVIFKVQFGFSSNHILAICNGLSFSMADLAYYMLSRSGMNVSTLGPLSSLYICIPVILGITVLKEPITAKKLLGLCFAVAAIYLLSSAEHEHHVSEIHTDLEGDVKKTNRRE